MNDTPRQVEPEFTHYRRSQITHLRPYVSGETLSDRVSISAADLEAGSPKPGDMIARNPANHDDQWLVAADYFAANFEPVSAAPAPEGGVVSIWSDARILFVRYAELFAMTERYEEASAIADKAALEIEALATREEAPAEAGEIEELFSQGHNFIATCKECGVAFDAHLRGCSNVRPTALRAQPQARAWGWDYEICTGCSASLTAADIKAGGHVSCCPDRRMVTVRDLVDAHEAQRKPQAREDAQPFGYWVEHRSGENPVLIRYGSFVPASDHYKITTLYTHPAPDALRVAAKKLAFMARTSGGTPGPDRDLMSACDAVEAALQAEQGAK